MAPKRKSASVAGIVSEHGDGLRARIFMNRSYTSGPTRPTRELAHADLDAARAGATAHEDIAAALTKQSSSSSVVPRAAVQPEPAAGMAAVLAESVAASAAAVPESAVEAAAVPPAPSIAPRAAVLPEPAVDAVAPLPKSAPKAAAALPESAKEAAAVQTAPEEPELPACKKARSVPADVWAATQDVRALSDQAAKWNYEFTMKFNTPFEKYIDPSEQLPDQVVIEPGIVAHDMLPPEVETQTAVRRVRLSPNYFLAHGYTAGCPGCIALRRKTGQSKNHSEECRLRMEHCLAATSEGRIRKEREANRREE